MPDYPAQCGPLREVMGQVGGLDLAGFVVCPRGIGRDVCQLAAKLKQGLGGGIGRNAIGRHESGGAPPLPTPNDTLRTVAISDILALAGG